MISKLLSYIPGMSTIKTYLLIGFGFSTTALLAVVSYLRFKNVSDKIQGQKDSIDTERRTSQVIIKGLQNEKEKLEDISITRGDFH